MTTFYRKEALIVKGQERIHFPTINAAKRESRKLQASGLKFKRPTSEMGFYEAAAISLKGAK